MSRANHLQRRGAVDGFFKDSVDTVLRVAHSGLRPLSDPVDHDAAVRRRVPNLLQYRLSGIVEPENTSFKFFFQEAVSRIIGDRGAGDAKLAKAVAQDL